MMSDLRYVEASSRRNNKSARVLLDQFPVALGEDVLKVLLYSSVLSLGEDLN